MNTVGTETQLSVLSRATQLAGGRRQKGDMNASRFSVELGFITVHFLAHSCVLLVVGRARLPPTLVSFFQSLALGILRGRTWEWQEGSAGQEAELNPIMGHQDCICGGLSAC